MSKNLTTRRQECKSKLVPILESFTPHDFLMQEQPGIRQPAASGVLWALVSHYWLMLSVCAEVTWNPLLRAPYLFAIQGGMDIFRAQITK